MTNETEDENFIDETLPDVDNPAKYPVEINEQIHFLYRLCCNYRPIGHSRFRSAECLVPLSMVAWWDAITVLEKHGFSCKISFGRYSEMVLFFEWMDTYK